MGDAVVSLPIRRQQFDTPGFAAWLAKHGAEVGVPTNPYEVVRYRAYAKGGKRPLTNIVYAKDNGLLNFQGQSAEHYAAFQSGEVVAGLFMSQFERDPATEDRNPFLVPLADRKPAKQSKSAITRERLLERDGDACWFCGDAMGEDMTIEHLVPKSKGGLNGLANYVLAHKRCNAAAADMPLVAKIEMRAKARSLISPLSENVDV